MPSLIEIDRLILMWTISDRRTMGNRPAEKLTFAQKHLALVIYNINSINEKGEHISIINRLHPLYIFVICIPLNGVILTADL